MMNSPRCHDQSEKILPKIREQNITDLIHVTNYNDKQSYVPLSNKFSNPVINSSSVTSTVFLFFPPIETMWEKSNSSKSSTLDLK